MASLGFGNTKEGIKEDFRDFKGDAKELKQDAKSVIKPMAIPAFSDLGKAANDVGEHVLPGGRDAINADETAR